ncbi:unnamed protein product [Parnassius apollo]|uniref:(apollo) hypothetical protein n=1 Tax=Parnassius apollo TaxID=110799 RepID=A0A8S3X7B9_PARAO|nr:unnamed protein product [Parnassius apollo]
MGQSSRTLHENKYQGAFQYEHQYGYQSGYQSEFQPQYPKKPSKEKTLKNVYENPVPSTSRESRDIAMLVYTENNSSDMEEPYSPVVSEYLPSHHTSRSSSLVRELCSPLPSSLIHDMINIPQNNSESTFKFDTPLKMHSIVDFIASPLIIYKNMNIIKNSKELADDSDITSQVNYLVESKELNHYRPQ